MSNYFYHPLGDFCIEVPPTGGHSDGNNGYYWNTYNNHGRGNIDMGYKNPIDKPIYSMCDGEVLYVKKDGVWQSGRWEDNSYCCIKCAGATNNLGIDFKIRYLHGKFIVNQGDYVTKGTQIGTVYSYGNSTGPHLHIDFSDVVDHTATMGVGIYGSLNRSNSTWTCHQNGKTYLINLDGTGHHQG